MSDMADDLFALAKRLDDVIQQAKSSKFETNPLKLREAANQVGRAWSGSWLGYQSRIYYEGLQPVPPGDHFSSEWGAFDQMPMGETIGRWREYTFESVRDAIFSQAAVRSLEKEEALSKQAQESFEHTRDAFVSTMTVALEHVWKIIFDVVWQGGATSGQTLRCIRGLRNVESWLHNL